MRRLCIAALAAAATMLAGCGSTPTLPGSKAAPMAIRTLRNDSPPSPAAREVVMQALTLLKLGYTWGGKTLESGLDCSGLVAHVYREAAGVRIGPDTRALAKVGKPVTAANLRGGDLVFFNTRNRPNSHVGIYVGNGEFVHAFNTRQGIRLDRMSADYFATRFDGARRLLG